MAASPILFLVHIAGAAALLIWSVRLVRTGVERAYSVQLRRWLRRSAERRILGAASGAAAAVALQSSTAVAVLVANFAAAGTIAAQPGLAIVLGADLGSAIVTQLLLLRTAWMAPVLLLTGVALFLRSEGRTLRQTGRILIGLALIFLALDMIREATEPLREAGPGTGRLLALLARDPLTAFVLGAGFAWLVHSSVAAVLLIVTLVGQGLVPVPAAAAMVLGANFGGAVIAFTLTLGAPVAARRIVVANLALRGGGALLALAGLATLLDLVAPAGLSPGATVIGLHLGFNALLLIVALPLLAPISALVAWLMPEARSAAGLPRKSALDPAALDLPERALACAQREVLRMGEEVETMLRAVLPLYTHWNDATGQAIRDSGKTADRMLLEIKLYLARIGRGDLDEDMARRSMDLAAAAVNVEAASETIARVLVDLARRIRDEGLSFSDAGRRELGDFHDRVLANVQLALNVMMTGEPDAARQLVAEKEAVREIEKALQTSHLARLRDGVAESIETSNIHQEALRALKQVNTAFAMTAYPILTNSGDLLSSRLSGGQG